MPDLKKYWQEIRAIEKSLPAEVWLVSLANLAKGQVAGSMVEAAAAVAAKLLYSKSQRWQPKRKSMRTKRCKLRPSGSYSISGCATRELPSYL